MALTDDEKAAVRSYLGRGDQFRDLDPALETQLAAISPAAEVVVRDALAKLGEVRDALHAAALNNLGLVKAEDVTFLGPAQLAALAAYGRALIQRLAILFSVAPYGDYFGEGAGLDGGVLPLG